MEAVPQYLIADCLYLPYYLVELVIRVDAGDSHVLLLTFPGINTYY